MANGRQCRVAWKSVCTPRWAGGLGVPNLNWLNLALQARWPWLQRTYDYRPWKGIDIKVPAEATRIYQTAAITTVGDGHRALFWEDRWINGLRAQELAPSLYSRIPQRIRKARTVSQALERGSWALDVGPDMEEPILREFLALWSATVATQLVPDVQDTI